MTAGITRSEFWRGALASWAAAAASGRATGALAQLAPNPATPPALSPLDLAFTTVERFRPFDLLPQPFVQVDEQFLRRAPATGLHPQGDPARIVHQPGSLRMASSRAEPTLIRTEAGPVAPYATIIVTAARTDAAQAGKIVGGPVRAWGQPVLPSL